MCRTFAVIPALALAGMLIAQALVAQTQAAAKPTSLTPRKADEFVIRMPDGSQKLLSSYRGKVVVMAFMYTTCSHCQHTAGVLAKVQTEYADKGVQILGVTFDANAERGIPTFIKITGANFPVGYSTQELVQKFMHASDGYFVPMLAIVDRAGTIRFENISYGDDGAADKFLLDQEVNIRKEIDKYLKPAGTARQAPKS